MVFRRRLLAFGFIMVLSSVIGGWVSFDRPAAAIRQSRLDTAAPAVSPGRPAASATAPLGAFEVCGGGWLQPKADGVVDGSELDAVALPAERRQRLVARLAAASDAYTRAVATWLRRADGDDAAVARIAVTSSDPKVYALAFQACRREPDHADCRRLSAAQWARLDPGNAAPWLSMLTDAAALADRAAVDEALYAIATSTRADFGSFTVAAPIADAVSGGESELLTGEALAIQAIGLQTAFVIPGYMPLLNACRGDAVQRDANRQQVCRAAAEVIAEHSDNLLGQVLGARIAAGLGGPADRAERLRNAAFAYGRADFVEGRSAQPLGCGAVRERLDRLRLQAEKGEVGALQEWVSQSARTSEDFARAYDRGVASAAAGAAKATVDSRSAASSPESADPAAR